MNDPVGTTPQPLNFQKMLAAKVVTVTTPAAMERTAKFAVVPEQRELPFAMNAQSIYAKNSLFSTVIILYPITRHKQILRKFETWAWLLG